MEHAKLPWYPYCLACKLGIVYIILFQEHFLSQPPDNMNSFISLQCTYDS